MHDAFVLRDFYPRFILVFFSSLASFDIVLFRVMCVVFFRYLVKHRIQTELQLKRHTFSQNDIVVSNDSSWMKRSLPFALKAIKMKRILFVRQKRETWKINRFWNWERRTAHAFVDNFFFIFCSGDPWKMLLLFRIGILSIDSNRRHQSTTANNGKWNVHTSKDDKTSIVTRHKCDAVTAVTFDAIGKEKMEHVLLFGPF